MISIKLHRNLIETSTRQRSQTAHLPSLPTSEHQAGVSVTYTEGEAQSLLCSVQGDTRLPLPRGFV